MKLPVFIILIVVILSMGCSPAAQKREQFLKEKMIPLAQQFISRNGLPYGANFGTTNITRYEVDFFDKKPGCVAELKLDNGCRFSFFWDGGTNTEIWDFHDRTKTGFNLAQASSAEVAAIKGLSLRNKLNDKTALELARHCFRLQGHKEGNFHPVDFGPNTWGQKGDPDYVQYPFYTAQWYRKDVNVKDRDRGIVELPSVRIEVSGISSNMVSYSKFFMPIGRDF